MKFPALLTASVLALGVSGSAIADPWAPSGSLVFTNPTGVVGPHDVVDGLMKFTLDSNSQAIDLNQPYSWDIPNGWTSVTRYDVGVGFGCDDTFSGGCNSAGMPYAFNFDNSANGYSKIQNASLVMNPGDMIDFNAFRMTPNVPAVPAGTYYVYRYVVWGNLTGMRPEQQFDVDGNPIVDIGGNPVFIEAEVQTSFNIAATCWGGVGCSSDQIFSRTVLAVPEPETYGMLLAGLGLIGVMSRRRKAQRA